MKKGIIYSLITGCIVFMSACAGTLQTYDLSEEYATTLHYKGTDDDGKSVEAEEEKSDLVGVPALSFYNGDLKRGAIWWAGKGITLEKGDVFVINAMNIGPDSTPFGATFLPIDLIKEKVLLKISARAESTNGDAPVLHLQVSDVDGYMANAKLPLNKIENSGDFKEYYFDLQDIYNQSFPKKHKVNGAMINSLKFFINPGQSAYTGKIFIMEIKIVTAASIVK